MRRTHTNEVVFLIAALLVAAALIFAWVRSKSHLRTTESLVTEPAIKSAGPEFAWQATGSLTYDAQCAVCHDQGQASSLVPPLRAHAVNLFEAEGGRDYLISFLLYGREGSIQVGDRTYGARHPTYEARLADEPLAATLNHMLTAWGNDALLSDSTRLVTPQDVAEHRQRTLTPEQVQALRPTLPPEG